MDCRRRRIRIGNGARDRRVVTRIRTRADVAGVGRAGDTRYATGETAIAERLDFSIPCALYTARAAVVRIQRQTDADSELRRLSRQITELRPDQRDVGEIDLAISGIGPRRGRDDRCQTGDRWITGESPGGICREIGTSRRRRTGPCSDRQRYTSGEQRRAQRRHTYFHRNPPRLIALPRCEVFVLALRCGEWLSRSARASMRLRSNCKRVSIDWKAYVDPIALYIGPKSKGAQRVL